MMNFKLGDKCDKDKLINMVRFVTKKKSESETGIEPITFRTVSPKQYYTISTTHSIVFFCLALTITH